ncbi:Predicted transcriptional regulator [Nitrosomonas marina]|uniref:Predicted transcriptional regulator n=1 Tax=Nitrosomonas marina TaxID=917 RepID=A0A1I0EEZ3_9PROT|nr:CopG family ribbon-helix-helix protein [Nitrosomonas marina]SET43095.1 Predicted transcriptional regulator [Nitrosomonas marina]
MGVTSIRLNSDVEAPLEELAQKLDRSKNYIINQAIKEFVTRQSMEDERWSDTLNALESVKSGNTVNEKEVSAWLQSWGSEEEKTPPGV